MEIDRRELLQMVPVVALENRLFAAPQNTEARVPWYAKMRRCGQTNFTERDVKLLNIDSWVEYWISMKVDAVIINAGGIVAFYPTKIPDHRRTTLFGDRDLFGDFAKALKKSGIHVVARIDPTWAYEDTLVARPEWAFRREKGERITHYAHNNRWLYRTCPFSSYYTEHISSIIKEVNSLYDPDGFFTNGFPSRGRPARCFCENCRDQQGLPDIEFYERHMARMIEIWKLWDSTIKAHKWDSLYVGNLGGSIRAVKSLKQFSEVAGWFNADHQGRNGPMPMWDCAQQGRLAQSVMKGRTITNVTGSYSNTRPRFAHTAKGRAETTIWLAQTTASGMVPWYTWEGGDPQDMRWKSIGLDFYQWIAKNESHFRNKRSIANLGLVYPQRTIGFYGTPGGGDVTEYVQGFYYALLEGRFMFDFVHEDDLGPETLKKYSALILPNMALMSDQQCRQLRAYVASGGSLLSTFETGVYDDRGKERKEFGLADVFGMEGAGPRQGNLGAAYYSENGFFALIERPHEILKGLQDTKWLPQGGFRRPVKAAGQHVLTVIPAFPATLPEMQYPDILRTDEPAAVIREKGQSRLVHFQGDIERSAWMSGNTDLSQLIQNTVHWLLRGQSPVTVQGEGVVETFAWETEPGFAVHILNYNNPNLHRGWARNHYPIRQQKVRMELPEGVRISSVRALRAEAELKHTQNGRVLEFVVPQVVDYEVAVAIRT